MKKGKFRVFSVLCAVMLCMVAFSQVVFASDGGNYESDESGDATAPDAITSIDIDTEAVPMGIPVWEPHSLERGKDI